MPQTVKNLPEVQEAQVRYLGWEDSMEKGMVTYSSILPGEFHGQRSLAGYSSWCPIELDMTELLRLLLFFFFFQKSSQGVPGRGNSMCKGLGGGWEYGLFKVLKEGQ